MTEQTERERAIEKRIADWLRAFGQIECGEGMAISAMRGAGPHFADAIERGDHMKGRTDVG